MSRQRFTLLIIAALVIIAAGFYVATQRSHPAETPGVALLPTLANQVNDVDAVAVRKGSATPNVTVHKSGTKWTVAEKADYPADVTKIRKLLLALRDAQIVEEKTSDPAKFAAIGVEDPKEGAESIEVSVSGPQFKQAVIVGKTAGDGNFVRRVSDNKTYSVEPGISVESEPKFWIDSRLIDVPTELLQSVEVKPATGPGYALHRTNPADNTYSLDGVPAGRQAMDGHALAPPASTFSSLTAEDVAPASEVESAPVSQVILKLSDGDSMTLTGSVIGTKHWLRLKASKDDALNKKADGRAFEIASYRYDGIFKPVEQLLVPKAPPPAPPPAKGHATQTPAPAMPLKNPKPPAP